ncbi:hypothetical protein HO173_000552 [Letharia columbiana]|uniref:Uncharacterized protein n=1 Tax=Letharia columbiana TaxID=112416 RepID=A0A8H6LAZ4_9LECA|nr:uncharacterized protein HO173_000552 [Letharia columbiana]KAF6241840.1 hypothetical protein HO173_000552 [Letharia columbiana]
MRPLPPAPDLPDLAEVLRKATVEGIRQGIAWAKKDKEEEESRLEIKRERDQSPESLFVTQDKNTKTDTHVAVTTLSSGPFAGLRSAKKRVREDTDLEEESMASYGSAGKLGKKAHDMV